MESAKRVSVLFDDIAASMLGSFDGWDKHIPHKGEKGGVRERRVRDFLEKHLPGRYGVASGHVIDKCGGTSLQEDIVIYDRFNCPALAIDPYYHVFPCETVYATVEVKSTLDSKAIAECVKHAHRLRKLERGDLGHVESFVFAYDSYGSSEKPSPTWASEKFKEMALSEVEQRPMPSVVLCLKKEFILHLVPMKDDYLVDELKPGILLYYFDHLLHRISLVRTSSPQLFKDYGWGQNSIMRYHKGNPFPIRKVQAQHMLTGASRDRKGAE